MERVEMETCEREWGGGEGGEDERVARECVHVWPDRARVHGGELE